MERVAVTPGTALGGRYLVQKPAWISSLGEAYVGRDTVLDRAVLVFPLPFDDPERVGALAQIHHPGLLQIYDAGPGWMVCEYPSGGRLQEKLASGPLDLGGASRAVRDVARALTALHAAGVAHGAIGSDLVVFDEEGRAKLAAGSFEGAATTADDDAALGSLSWRTFTGTEPGAGRASKLPPTVADLLRRMISSDPVLRPRLREIDETLAPYARTTLPEPKASFLRQEARWLVPVLGLIAVGVAAVIVGLRIDLGPIKIGGPPKPRPAQRHSRFRRRPDSIRRPAGTATRTTTESAAPTTARRLRTGRPRATAMHASETARAGSGSCSISARRGGCRASSSRPLSRAGRRSGGSPRSRGPPPTRSSSSRASR